MSNQESEIERSLNNAVPLPCSIDSMQLMFDAGVEEQKRKSKNSRRLVLASTSLSCVFMISTLTLAVWSYQLSNQNNDLLATIQSGSASNDLEQGAIDSSKSESPKAGSKNSKSSTTNESGAQQTNQNSSDQETRQNRRGNSMLYTFETPLTNRDSSVQTLMLRGVALRPEDEYRNPVQSGQTSFYTSESTDQSKINSRQRLQSDLLGL